MMRDAKIILFSDTRGGRTWRKTFSNPMTLTLVLMRFKMESRTREAPNGHNLEETTSGTGAGAFIVGVFPLLSAAPLSSHRIGSLQV